MKISSELSCFVRDALNLGQSRDDIRADLAASDWTPLEIDLALDSWNYIKGTGAVPRPQRSTAAWDALFYALLFAAFGFLMGHTLHLVLGFITMLLPDHNDTLASRSLNGMRWSMAAVLIFAPAFLLLHRTDAKASIADPVRKHGTIRRWLASLAIFTAAITLMCDAIYVLYAFLDGEITPRFLAKSGAVALIACLVLIYFDEDRRNSRRNRAPGAWLCLLVALATLAVSFWMVGGPAQGKMELRDRLRLSDLQLLENAVQFCAELKGKTLPETLDPMSCAQAPERLTGFAQEVTYDRLDPQRFELCIPLEAPDRAASYRYSTRKGDAVCMTSTLR